jgi:hypothetical protein
MRRYFGGSTCGSGPVMKFSPSNDGLTEYRSASRGVHAGLWNAADHCIQLVGVSGAGYQYVHLGASPACTADAFPTGIRCGMW